MSAGELSPQPKARPRMLPPPPQPAVPAVGEAVGEAWMEAAVPGDWTVGQEHRDWNVDPDPPAGSLEDVHERVQDLENQMGKYPQALARSIAAAEDRICALQLELQPRVTAMQAEIDYLKTWAGWLSYV